VDEFNIDLWQHRTRGYARIGEKSIVIVPDAKGPRLSVIIAVDLTHGVIHDFHLSDTINGPAFDDFCTDLVATYAAHVFEQA
jgi:hypothetical protein